MAKQSTDTAPVRIPLVGSYNPRVSISADSSSGYVGIGIVGTMVVGAATIQTKDQRFINIISEKVVNEFTGKETYYVYKRPGMEAYLTPESGSFGYALRLWTGSSTGDNIISAFSDGSSTTSNIYDGTILIGSTTGVVTQINEALVGTTANLSFVTDSNTAYYYPEGGSLTQITDADFPGNASKTITGNFVHLDGYTFIMTTDGGIYNSELNSISSWDGSFIAANMYPDQGVGLARYKDLIVAFGKQTMEMFRDVGNATGSPLERVGEAFAKIGAVSAQAICELEDNVAWVAATDIGSTSVYILDGYKPMRISTDAIDTQLALRGGAPIYLSSVKLFGKTLIFVMFSNATYVHCLEDKMWFEWTPPAGTPILWHKWAGAPTVGSPVYALSTQSNIGKVFRVNPVSLVYQDDGSNYTMTIQTSKLDMGTERLKRLPKLTIVGDTPTSAATLNVSWSDDDYQTFSTVRTIALASGRKYLNNCGSFRRRAFKLTETSSVALRLEALELQLMDGLH